MKANIVRIGSGNMSGKAIFPDSGGSVSGGSRARTLRQDEEEHTRTLFSLFEKHLIGTRANSAKTVTVAMGAICGFAKYVGVPPWEWNEQDFSEFMANKVTVDGIGLGRQSTYITYLRAFQNYLLDSRGLSNEIHRRFDVQPQRFINNENAIPVRRKRHERKKQITPLSGEQCNGLIVQFDHEINLSGQAGKKSFNPMRRDKAIVMIMLLTGIRVDELVKLRINDFMPDARHPNFGNFSTVRILCGKGRKSRVVRFYNPIIKDLMNWYLDDVRPGFLRENTSDPQRLFLSERGTPLCTEQVRRMLAHIASQATIPFKVTPHLLRHTYGTQMAKIIGAEALQRQLGHENLTTTLGTYYHQDPEHVGNEIELGITNFTKGMDAMTQGLLDEIED